MLRAGRFADRIPVGARFSTPVHKSCGAHPASYTIGNGSFPRVKRPGRGFNNPLPSSAEAKERVEPYLYSTYGPSWTVLGRVLYFIFTPITSSLLLRLPFLILCIIVLLSLFILFHLILCFLFTTSFSIPVST